mmetsp:Transcript_29498/g.65411  ORF Transcript_29498/g.65411 Transcript_29498/m.65411 type:complete len:451 (-) Transcript_29498:3016-4368(-)
MLGVKLRRRGDRRIGFRGDLMDANRSRIADLMDATRSRVARDGAGNRDIPTNRLPCLASDVYGLGMNQPIGWSPTVRTMMAGSKDSQSTMSALEGSSDQIMPTIFEYASRGSEHVTLTIPASRVGFSASGAIIRYNEGRNRTARGYLTYSNFDTVSSAENVTNVLGERVVAFASCGSVQFPKPQDISVNMMPFVIGDRNSLPPQLHPYYDNLVLHCPYDETDVGKVGYISVQESMVEAGTSQRRAGLHIDSPGVFEDQTTYHLDRKPDIFYPGLEHAWGMGMMMGIDRFKGGIYVASTVQDSTEVYDALVHKSTPGIVDRHGGCEHLRRFCGKGTKLMENELVWLTDETPHESLLLRESQYRQFFRFVGPYVSHWYADHSTANPLCPVPDDVIIVRGNKFGIGYREEEDCTRKDDSASPLIWCSVLQNHAIALLPILSSLILMAWLWISS